MGCRDIGAVQNNKRDIGACQSCSTVSSSLSSQSASPSPGTCDVRQTWALAEALNVNDFQGPASPFPVLAGSTIIVTVSLGSIGDGTTFVTDTRGNVYTQVVADTGTLLQNEVSIWAAQNANPGVTQITVSASGTVNLTFGAVEVPGLGALDKKAFNKGVSATPTTGNTGTLSQSNEFAVIALCPSDVANQVITTPSGWTRRANESGNTFIQHDGATKSLNSAAALNPQWTLFNSTSWLAVIATWRCVGVSPSSLSPSSISPISVSPISLSPVSQAPVSSLSVSLRSSSSASVLSKSSVSGTSIACRTITSQATGNLSNPATWVGGAVPGQNPNFNDQIILAAGHKVTVDIPTGLGCNNGANAGQANAAIVINTGSELVIGSSILLQVRGDCYLINGILTWRDNSIYEWDPRLAPAGTAYQIIQGTASNQTSNLLRTQNTSANNRGILRTNQTVGLTAGYISAPFNNSTFVNLAYMYFVQVGDTTNDGMTWRITAAGTTEVMDHCDMNNCGCLPVATVNIVATSGFNITNCTWRNTNARTIATGRPMSMYLTTANAPITGTRIIDHCVTDAAFGIAAPGLTLTNSYLAKNWTATIGGVASQWAKCDGNIVNVPGLGSPDPSSVDARIKPQGEFSNNYILCYTGNAAADSGTATGVQTSTTLQDTSKTWTVNQFQGNGQVFGWGVYKQDGFGINVECRAIQTNTANTLTLDFPFVNPAVSGVTTYEIILQNANPNICDFPTLTNTSFHLHHQIFDFPGGQGNGDCYLHGSVTGSPSLVDYNIVLPCASGKSTGTIVTGGGTAVGSTCTIEHNTYGAGSACFMQNETATNANWCIDFLNNIAWVDPSVVSLLVAGNGLYKTTELPTNNPGSALQDVIIAGAADFNCGWNLTAGYSDATQWPGQGGIGYNCNASQPMGVHDIDVNPQFLDSTRNIYKWGVSKGLTGTFCTVINQALAQMQKMNDDTGFNSAFTIKGNSAALWDYVWKGFTPQNQAIIGTASDGTTFGAVQVGSSSSSVGGGSSLSSLKSSSSFKSASSVSQLSLSPISQSSASLAPLSGTLYFTGFETGDNSEIALLSGTASVQNSIVDHGDYSLRANPVGAATGFANLDGTDPASGLLRAFTAADGLTTTWIRFKFRPNVAPASNDEELFSVADVTGGNDKFYLRCNSARKLVAYDRNLSVLGTGATVLSTSSFVRVEAKVGIGSNGTWEVKINGNVEIGGTAAVLGNAPAFCRLGKINNRNSQTVDWIFDDFFWSQVGYPGPGICQRLAPAADGSFANGTPNGTAQLWQCLNQVPPDGDTTYINGLGLSQQYTAIIAPPIVGTVNSYKTVVLSRPDLPGTYTTYQEIFDLDPNGSTWTDANVNIAQPGFTELAANADRITTLFGMVDYVVGAGSSSSSQSSPSQLSVSPISLSPISVSPKPSSSQSVQPSISQSAQPSVSQSVQSAQPSPSASVTPSASLSAQSSAQPSTQPSPQSSFASSLSAQVASSISAQISALSSAFASLSSQAAQPSGQPSATSLPSIPSISSTLPSAQPGLIILDVCFFGQNRHGNPNTKVVTTGSKPLIVGSGITFEVSPFLNDLFWDLTGGSASLMIAGPQGDLITIPATIIGVGALANWTVPIPVPLKRAIGTWVRAWVLTDAVGTHEISQPIIFQVQN